MGLDLIPIGKPKPDCEKDFYKFQKLLSGKEKQNLSFFERIRGKKAFSKEELWNKWMDTQISAFETIKAPRVGRDVEADKWIQDKYLATDKSISIEDFMKKYNGYYVVELAKEKDGIPMYVSPTEDRHIFRGQFIETCKDIIDEDLALEAWGNKNANETLDYGKRLLELADSNARKYDLIYLKEQIMPPDLDEDTMESKIHIIYSLARWLIFYGKNGHGYEAYF